jgi:2-methylcitrate dehydratase PrpD
MFRIGRATHHSCETKGFHAPGLTGPFGAAIAVGRLLKLDAQAMTGALGIAGSLASGLLEFARSGNGSMVKKLHLARAAESGVLAAELAARGMTGPDSVLDGPFGFLTVFCAEAEPAALAGDLGAVFESDRLCFKRYPCHITAHAPVEAALALKQRHGFTASEVAAIRIAASAKAARLHDIPRPADMGLAQYSIPFCVATALLKDIADPRHFHGEALADPAVLAMASRIAFAAAPAMPGGDPWAAEVTITLADGRTLSQAVDTIPGTPAQPFTPAQRREKFLRLASDAMGRAAAARQFARLEALESEPSTGWIGARQDSGRNPDFRKRPM